MEKIPTYKAELVGVFGHPVAENPTIVLQEAAFRKLNLNWRYLILKYIKMISPMRCKDCGLSTCGHQPDYPTQSRRAPVLGRDLECGEADECSQHRREREQPLAWGEHGWQGFFTLPG